MPTSTIDRVKSAELAALDLQSRAETEALRIAEDAKAKADAIIDAARKEALAVSGEKLQAAQLSADLTVKEAKENAEEKARALYDTTLKKQDLINQLFLDSLV